MQRLACCLVLVLAATNASAVDPIPNDSFDYFFENQKMLRDKAKKERQQYLLPKGERFTNNKDAKDAIISLRWFAVAGDPDAQAALGDLFGKGLYEPHNIKSAVYWWNLAAENGSLYGQYMMGLSYQLGWLGAPDAVKANEYFSNAQSNDDSPRARRQVAQFFGDRENAMYNFDESYRWYESAAEAGDVQSQLTLGDFYTNG
jgi:TPR repeat protein